MEVGDRHCECNPVTLITKYNVQRVQQTSPRTRISFLTLLRYQYSTALGFWTLAQHISHAEKSSLLLTNRLPAFVKIGVDVPHCYSLTHYNPL